MLHSIRSRITLWHLLAAALVLGGCGLFWYRSTAAGLHARVDARLLTIAESLAGESVRKEPPYGKDLCTAAGKLADWQEESLLVTVFTPESEVFCSTGPALEEAPPAPAGPADHPSFFTVSGSGEGAELRVLEYPLLAGSQTYGTLQIAQSTSFLQQVLSLQLKVMLATSTVALLLLAAATWLLAGRLLRPLTMLGDAMQRVHAENLSERLPQAEGGSETGQLIQRYNRMLEHLEGSFRRTRQFSADAAHELRTPLTVLRGETEVALRWTKDPEEFRSILESNLEEIDRMGRIIEDLLLLSKSEAGEIPMEAKEVNLNDLVHDLYLQGKILGENKGIAVSLELPESQTVRVMGDELRLHQMLLNLVSNGIKYTPTGGRVSLKLAQENGQAVITVADTGYGMAPEHLARIFDRFYRIDRNRNQESGAGLGLSIVKWIVDAHSGHITVTSEPDKGSTFQVFLPAENRS